MRAVCRYRLLATGHLLLAICYLLISGCSLSIPRLGIGGSYLGGRDEFLKGRGGNMDKAVVALETVVREDPTYKDSLTLLGRAYYRKGRYEDAGQILKRALAVNNEDEIAWIILGLTQLRLRENQKGLETLKGGITLLIKVSTDGYRDYPDWDSKGLVRRLVRRTVVLLSKGLDERKKIIRAVETLLIRLDDEESFQRAETQQILGDQ